MNTTNTNKQDILSFIPAIEAIVDIIKGNLPYDIDSLDDLDNLDFCPDAVYCHWINTYFIDEDEAIEFLKNDDAALRAAINGYLTLENRPMAFNSYSGSLDDGGVWMDNIDEIETALEELKSIAEQLVDLGIDITSTDFSEIVEEIHTEIDLMEEEEKEEA